MVRRWWSHPILAGVSVGLTYLVAALSVMAVQVWSETAKLDRGAFTDTFDALTFARLMAFPSSLLVAPTAKGDRQALEATAQQIAAYALVQAVVLAVLVGSVAALDRWAEKQ